MMLAAIELCREARTLAVPSAAVIDPALWAWTKGGATLITDGFPVYRWIGRKVRGVHRVRHSVSEYARTDGDIRVHTNTEAFFGLFMRDVVGVWSLVSPKLLHHYASGHEFRWIEGGSWRGSGNSNPARGREAAVAERIARCVPGWSGRMCLRESLA